MADHPLGRQRVDNCKQETLGARVVLSNRVNRKMDQKVWKLQLALFVRWFERTLLDIARPHASEHIASTQAR